MNEKVGLTNETLASESEQSSGKPTIFICLWNSSKGKPPLGVIVHLKQIGVEYPTRLV